MTDDLIYLTWAELAVERVFETALARHTAMPLRDLYGAAGTTSAEGYKLHREGAAGELAFARYIGVPWDRSVNTFKQPDVAGWHVRTRTNWAWDLIIRAADPDGPYVLVLGHSMPTHYLTGQPHPVNFRIAGYYPSADDARTHPEWVHDYGAHGEAWFVPQSALLPIPDSLEAPCPLRPPACPASSAATAPTRPAWPAPSGSA